MLPRFVFLSIIAQKTCKVNRKNAPYGAFFSALVNSHINLSSQYLTKSVLRELFISHLKKSDLLVGNCGLVVSVDVLLEVFLRIGDAVLFKVVLVGEDLCNDGVVFAAATGFTLVNDDLKRAGSCVEVDIIRIFAEKNVLEVSIGAVLYVIEEK